MVHAYHTPIPGPGETLMIESSLGVNVGFFDSFWKIRYGHKVEMYLVTLYRYTFVFWYFMSSPGPLNFVQQFHYLVSKLYRN